jgi:hypothetical protein
MNTSLWIILVLILFLFVVYLSNPLSRRLLREGFAVDYSKPAVDLTKEPEFMAFYKFHTEVCALWNNVIDEIMKNDCVDPESKCPPKPQYINNLKTSYNETAAPKICFSPCETLWSPTSSLKELDVAIPSNINCYKGTLQYIVEKSQEMITKVQDAIARIPSQDSFADYEATINCKTDAKGTATCTDPNGNTYISQQPKSPQKDKLLQSEQDQLTQQINATNKIIVKCRTMNTEIPELKAIMAQAKTNVEQLRKIKQQAQDGTLLPAPAKT